MKLQFDDSQERLQGFRSAHKSQRPSTATTALELVGAIFIACQVGDYDSQLHFIFWEDIRQAFENALNVRVGTKMVLFLRGQDYRFLEPRRIACVPGVILDVVVESAYSQPPDGAQDDGAGITKDLVQTIIGASRGDIENQVAVRDLYRKNQGVKRDYRAALNWYITAADQGHLRAQYCIGLLYTNNNNLESFGEPKRPNDDSDKGNHGIPTDYPKALEWFVKAARQGLVEVQVMAAILIIARYDASVEDFDQETTSAIVQWIFNADN
ncbi:hypothetical protein BGZ95_010009 [Linnemannia exigua]|uniref:HCP-like protein n=1 Tax=Linnemannia exigua TaxID=604196 RepID=A0AAD4DC54_9FUNG|nr:hypothetical protein BGZ95_010009 [Linnemannia exigua]